MEIDGDGAGARRGGRHPATEAAARGPDAVSSGPLWLGPATVAELLDPAACVAAVEQALRRLGEPGAARPVSCGVHVPAGGFHVKAAALEIRGRTWFAAKANANFPGNPAARGLPTVQGVVVLADGSDGRPLAVLDSAVVTARRTAATTAVAAKHLARRDASVLTLCGCGTTGGAHLRALAAVLPLRQVWLVDPDETAVRRLAEEAATLGIPAAAADLRAASGVSDVIVTCTPSREFLLGAADVRPGTFVAGIGVDDPRKRELHPSLLAGSTLVVDDRDQCARMGDFHHALAAGALGADGAPPELSEVVAGRSPGRREAVEVTVFDSTGIAVGDVAAAVVVYEAALAAAGGGAPTGAG